MHYLACTDSVHTTAAICDYLDERVTTDDAVTVVTVVPAGEPEARRDGQEALTVAPVRLTGLATLETELLEGEPVQALLEVATERDVDELLVGAHGGRPDATGVGSTVTGLLADAERPIVVVPQPAF